jgi:uncharacterized protein (DUF39 family)
MSFDIKCDVLLVLETVEKEDRKIELRVVNWITKGRNTPLLEKRSFFRDEKGDWKMAKAKGFNMYDIKMVADRMDEIKNAFASADKAPVQAQAEDEPF